MTRLPASIIRSASLAQPIIQQASIGLERPLTSMGGTAAGLHVDARLQHAAIGERQCTGRWRAARIRRPATSARSSRPATGASDRLTVAVNARHQRLRLFIERDVPAPERAQLCRLGDEPAVGQHEPRRGLGPVGAGRAASAVRELQRADLVRRARGLQHAGARRRSPYNVTTGVDDNGDTVFNDRDAGCGPATAAAARGR